MQLSGENLRPECDITIHKKNEVYLQIECERNIAKELNNYVYADKGSKLYVDSYNHAIDAIRYNVIYHLDNPNYGRYFVQ